MFVLSSDFDVPPFSIPDLGSNNSFADYVEDLEAEILKKLLGKTIYDQFIAGLDAFTAYSASAARVIGDHYSYGNDVWEALTTTAGVTPVAGSDWTLVEEDNKWLLLKNGNDYEYSDNDYEWYGMVKMLKPYVYSKWLTDQYDTHTSAGVVVANTENSTVISPARRIAAAYNKFSEIAGAKYCTENSLYGYFVANEVLYPDAATDFKEQGFMNAWNI